jgi:iron(III) transport system ATP-binding protein
MDSLLWEMDGVCLRGGPVPRLHEVSLRIRRGVTAVMGCSGAGKTSLLNLLVGFERPDRGLIRRAPLLNGSPLPLYWIPAEGGLWPHLTVREHLQAVSAPGAPDAAGLLAALDMADRAGAYPEDLSAGERSRVAVARALAARASVIVADEPLAHVDEARSGRYWRLLREHVAAGGASLVFATHSPKLVIGEADHVVCLTEGRVLYEGDVEELYLRPGSRAQAECLGEVNWLEADEAACWLPDAEPGRRCFRPEHLAVEPAADGALVVRSSRCRGAVSETELVHEGTGEIRRFHHRPCGGGLAAGARVLLKALALLFAVWLAGCSGRGEPSLAVRNVHYRSVPAEERRIPAPRAAAVGAAGELFVVDRANRVVVFGPDGRPARTRPQPDSKLGASEGICVLQGGRVAITDTHYSRVLLYEPDGALSGQFGQEGRGPGEFIYPVGVTQDPEGYLYVAEYGGNDRVQKFTADGKFVLAFGMFGTAPDQFQRPSGLAWRDGRLYVADAMNNRIQVFSGEGRFLGTLAGPDGPPPLRFPYDIAFGPDGALYVVEYDACRLTKLSPDGQVLGRYGSPGTGEGQLYTPWGLAVGPDLRVYIADAGNRRIVELQL